MKSGTLLKRTPFKVQPYRPLRQTGSLQSGTRLRKSGRPITSYKVLIGDRKVLIWYSERADTEFSLHIRKRDGRCKKCGSTEKLTNSHFHGRGNSSTRYNEDNCDTLCESCHIDWEAKKREGNEYYIFKLNQLGNERFAQLAQLANTMVSRETAIVECMKLLLLKK